MKFIFWQQHINDCTLKYAGYISDHLAWPLFKWPYNYYYLSEYKMCVAISKRTMKQKKRKWKKTKKIENSKAIQSSDEACQSIVDSECMYTGLQTKISINHRTKRSNFLLHHWAQPSWYGQNKKKKKMLLSVSAIQQIIVEVNSNQIKSSRIENILHWWLSDGLIRFI